VRLLTGTLELHHELEQALASFLRQEAVATFASGYDANIAAITSLFGPGDHALLDQYAHQSIMDGVRMAGCETRRFRHNDMEDLERQLNRIEPERGRLIAVDGVFSMEGDIAPLPEIVRIARKYNARILCDDAHSLGVLGPRGDGTPPHFGLTDDIDLVMGTFSKSFASIGGVIGGEAVIVDYIKHVARPMIFSAALPPYAVATVHKCLDIMKSEPERRERLWQITRKMLDGFKSLGFDTCTSETPIIPIMIGDLPRTFVFWKSLFDAGIFANAVVPPAVPENGCRIRTSYMATHTDDQLDFVLETFARIGKQVGLI
jgi:8-amino-7-oxononanoate synthase